MLLPTLLSAGALTLTANAFLVPLAISEKVNRLETLGGDVTDKVAQSLKAFGVTHPEFQTVRLDCSTCPFALISDREGRHEWATDVDNELELKFSSENGRVSLNGKPFYPISNPPLPPILSAKQIQKESDASAKKWEGYHGDLTLSYSLEIENKKHFNADKTNLVSIVFTIMGLDGEMVNVDDIEILVIETENERIIHSITTVPASPNRPDAKCTTIFCRVLTRLRTTMQAAKSASHAATKKIKICCLKCMQFFGKAGSQNSHGDLPLPTHVHVKPGQTDPQVDHTDHVRTGHHVHGQHHRGWLHGLVVGIKRVFSFILFPILVGIAFGVTASAVGMLMGQLVVLLWMRYRRSSTSEVAYERLGSDEKEGLPAYEEIEGVDVKEEEKEVVEKV
ncbi:hypothetical protein MMC29_008491 [Sticta canariensis]|nr:hypothetical protein [Sticta canariensis]